MQNTQERIPRYARNDIHAESVIARSPGTALDPLDRPPWSGLRPDLEAQRASNLQGDVAIRLLSRLTPHAYLPFLPEISITWGS